MDDFLLYFLEKHIGVHLILLTILILDIKNYIDSREMQLKKHLINKNDAMEKFAFVSTMIIVLLMFVFLCVDFLQPIDSYLARVFYFGFVILFTLIIWAYKQSEKYKDMI